MRQCVAINCEGQAIGIYNSLKKAATDNGLRPDRLRQCILQKKVVKGFLWMYEDDYIKLAAKGRNAWDVMLGRKKDEEKKTRKKRPKEALAQYKETQARNKMYRKKVISSFFRCFAKHHIKWLQQLKNAWLERGDFGIRPELLMDYYQEKKDKEVAMLAAIFIPDNGHCYDNIQEMKEYIGPEPWKWFVNRGFITKSTIKLRSLMAQVFNEWWMECFKYGKYRYKNKSNSYIHNV